MVGPSRRTRDSRTPSSPFFSLWTSDQSPSADMGFALSECGVRPRRGVCSGELVRRWGAQTHTSIPPALGQTDGCGLLEPSRGALRPSPHSTGRPLPKQKERRPARREAPPRLRACLTPVNLRGCSTPLLSAFRRFARFLRVSPRRERGNGGGVPPEAVARTFSPVLRVACPTGERNSLRLGLHNPAMFPEAGGSARWGGFGHFPPRTS